MDVVGVMAAYLPMVRACVRVCVCSAQSREVRVCTAQSREVRVCTAQCRECVCVLQSVESACVYCTV